MSSRSARRSDRRRHVSSSVEVDAPAKLNLRSVKKEPDEPDEAEGEMTPEMVADIWAEFAADHYEIVEQLPLELHRNSRLLRELDQESLSQQERLQSRIREYVAHRIALATKPTPKVEPDEGMDVDGPSGSRPRTPAPEPAAAAQPSASRQSSPEAKPQLEPTPAADGAETTLAPPESARAKSKSKSRTPVAHAVSILSPDSSKMSETPVPAKEKADAMDVDAEGSPEADALGSPDPDALGSPDPDALGSPDPDAAGSPDPAVQAAPTPTPNAVSMSRQSSSSEVGAVDDAVAIDDERDSVSEPRVEKPNPSSASLGEIARLMRELVRNREEKVAIAIGAYNAIDRHIRALDYALNAQESSLLGLSTEPVPAVEEPPAGKKDKKRKKDSLPVVPPVLPPNIEVDPNEPRYCYCNNVSYGEMVGCDNEDCPYEWFHLACLGMTAAPVGNWLCDACRPGGSGVKETSERPKGPKRRKKFQRA